MAAGWQVVYCRTAFWTVPDRYGLAGGAASTTQVSQLGVLLCHLVWEAQQGFFVAPSGVCLYLQIELSAV